MKTYLVNLLLSKLAILIRDLDPNIVERGIWRLLVTLLVLSIKVPALEQHKQWADSVADPDNCPGYMVSGWCISDKLEGRQKNRAYRGANLANHICGPTAFPTQ